MKENLVTFLIKQCIKTITLRKTQITGCLGKKYIQLWKSISNIFYPRKTSNIYKYNTLVSVISIITCLGGITELYLK